MKLPYFLVQPAITLPLLAASAFAIYAPVDWASSEHWPYALLEFISLMLPPIAGYTKNSHFPAITQIYMAFTFMLLPLHAWYTYATLSKSKDEPWFKILWDIDSWWAFLKRTLLVILIGVLLHFSLFINPGYDFNLLPLNSSRIALGFGGWIVAGGVQGHLLAWIFCNLLVLKKFIGSR